jgi:hypothetical protein
VRRGDVERELLDEPRQSRRLSFGNLQHESRQGRGVDDGMLEGALQSPAHEPGVKSVVAVLDEDGAVRETQEGAPRVAKLRRADEHRTVDVMAPVGVWIDRRLAINQRVEEGERAVEPEALRADLQDEERRVSGGLHVEGYERRLIQPRLRPELGCVDRDLCPCHGFHRSARFQEERFRAHRAIARARRAQSISSLVNPRRSKTVAP